MRTRTRRGPGARSDTLQGRLGRTTVLCRRAAATTRQQSDARQRRYLFDCRYDKGLAVQLFHVILRVRWVGVDWPVSAEDTVQVPDPIQLPAAAF